MHPITVKIAKNTITGLSASNGVNTVFRNSVIPVAGAVMNVDIVNAADSKKYKSHGMLVLIAVLISPMLFPLTTISIKIIDVKHIPPVTPKFLRYGVINHSVGIKDGAVNRNTTKATDANVIF